MSSTPLSAEIRRKWNKEGRKDIVNDVIDEAMRQAFIEDGGNRKRVRTLFEEVHNRPLPEE